MNISRTSKLEKPKNNKKISSSELAYVCERNRLRAYTSVVKEFERSGIQQSDLAIRLGKEPAQINRWLSRPANWELDTYSLLLFGISGAFPKFDVIHPLEARSTTFTLLKSTTAESHNDNWSPESNVFRQTL